MGDLLLTAHQKRCLRTPSGSRRGGEAKRSEKEAKGVGNRRRQLAFAASRPLFPSFAPRQEGAKGEDTRRSTPPVTTPRCRSWPHRFLRYMPYRAVSGPSKPCR